MKRTTRVFCIALGAFVISWCIATQAQAQAPAPASAPTPADYSPAWFGPHALPVPEVSDGRIPEHTRGGFSTDYSFGHGIGAGDRTVGFRLDAEIPLVPRHASFRLWYDVYELYSLSPAVQALRGIENPSQGRLRGGVAGDVYVQTRISVLGERENRPQIIISATLKTASGGQFPQRRFYDTPGYWFDFQIAKSFFTDSEALKEIRLVAQGGFLCWETTGSVQNDAPMYGLNLILANKWVSLENQIGGYCGWMRHGDRPLAYRAKLTYNYKFVNVFCQYQFGIIDFPYHQIRLGCSFDIARLTPRYDRPHGRDR
jgi:hypothetical protein